jgi:hypothetical protein
LAFSLAISSIEIEFDALTDLGAPPAETIFNFSNSNGAVSIGYTNQDGTTFDGTTITATTATTPGNGQGIITFAGPTFNSFAFDHSQGIQNGFVIDRIVIDSAVIPEPSTALLLGFGLVDLSVRRHPSRDPLGI